jgi:Flp pilus assembly pilin Flp
MTAAIMRMTAASMRMLGIKRSRKRSASERHRPRAGAGPEKATRGGALRRWVADEAGSLCIEYVLIAVLVGVIPVIVVLATIGPALVSMWSDQRACLYDDVCVSRAPQ